jgi:hypothetical protein
MGAHRRWHTGVVDLSGAQGPSNEAGVVHDASGGAG